MTNDDVSVPGDSRPKTNPGRPHIQKTAKSNRNDGRRSAARAGGDAGIGPAIRPDPGWGRIRGFGRFVGQVHHDSAAHGTDHAEHRVQGKAGGL